MYKIIFICSGLCTGYTLFNRDQFLLMSMSFCFKRAKEDRPVGVQHPLRVHIGEAKMTAKEKKKKMNTEGVRDLFVVKDHT